MTQYLGEAGWQLGGAWPGNAGMGDADADADAGIHAMQEDSIQ